MQRLLMLGLFVLLSATIYGQKPPSLHFQNAYFITGQPIFGLGFELPMHPSFSVMGSAEYGRYASVEEELLSANIESYSLTGFGLQGEVRWYCFAEKREDQRGFFLSAFFKQRWMKEYEAEGISAFHNELSLQNLEVKERFASGRSLGLLTGYRVSCGDSPFAFEIIAGGGHEWQDWKSLNPQNQQPKESKSQHFTPRAHLGFVYQL